MNKVTLHGRLTITPELRTTNSGTSVCKSTIAVDRKFKTDGETQSDFLNLIAFGKTAEFLSKYFEKGKEILLDGSIQNNNYTDKNDIKRYETIIVVNEIDFCGTKSDSGNSNVNTSQKATTKKDKSEIIGSSEDDESLPF